MRPFRNIVRLAALLLALNASARPQTPPSAAEVHAITSLLNKSVEDWNRGDLDAFATSYKNSPDILFMGRTIQHGYAQMLARYKSAYPNQAAMGKLSFTQLEVQPLDARFATVTGTFHLERSTNGGGSADGYFLLVVEHTPAGWKIIRDATTALRPPTPK
jgi:ketosteroid isomerase-like protein